jgi:hypothetical protein
LRHFPNSFFSKYLCAKFFRAAFLDISDFISFEKRRRSIGNMFVEQTSKRCAVRLKPVPLPTASNGKMTRLQHTLIPSNGDGGTLEIVRWHETVFHHHQLSTTHFSFFLVSAAFARM